MTTAERIAALEAELSQPQQGLPQPGQQSPQQAIVGDTAGRIAALEAELSQPQQGLPQQLPGLPNDSSMPQPQLPQPQMPQQSQQPQPQQDEGGMLSNLYDSVSDYATPRLQGAADYALPVLRGASMGLADDIMSLGGATRVAMTSDESVVDAYHRIKGSLEDRQDRFTEENPVYSTVADIAGGIGSGVGAAKLLKPFFKIGTAAGASAIGALEGGISGVGNSQEDGNMLLDTAIAAAGGAVLGPIFNAAGNAITGAGARNSAGRALRREMNSKGIDTADVNTFLQNNPRGMPADMDAFSMMSAAAANTPGPGQVSAYQALSDRQQSMASDVAELMQTKTGGRIDFNAHTKELDDFAIAAAKPFYDQAHAATIPITPTMKNFMDDRKMQPLWNKARSRFETINGRVPTQDVNKIYRLRDGQSPNVTDYNKLELWDYFKQELDQKITRSYRGGYGTVGEALKPRRAELLSELDSVVPAYKEARNLWSDSSKMKEALAEGRKILRTDFDDQYVDGLTRGENAMYINGATRALVDKAQSFSEGGNSARNLLNKPQNVKRMRRAFPDDASFKDFMSSMRTIADQGRTHALATQGSKTTPLAAAMSDLNSSDLKGVPVDLLQGNYVQAAKGLTNTVFNKRNDYMNAERAQEVTDALFSTDTKKLIELTRRGLLDPNVVGGLLGATAAVVPNDY